MAAHIANRGNITVREFISEFRGMSSTAKQKVVLAETGASHVSLHNFFGRHKANTDNIAKLLASLQKHTKPVRPAELGMIGKEHFYRRHGGGGRRSEDVHLQSKRWRNGRRPAGDRVRLRHPSRRPHRRSRAEPESHHGRQLVARHQQSFPATRTKRRRARRASWPTSAPTLRSRSSLCCISLVRAWRTRTGASRRSWSKAT